MIDQLQVSEAPGDWIVMEEVDSTNLELLQGNYPAGTVLVARHQKNGRGRRGRHWVDDPSGSFIFSAYLELDAAALGSRRVLMLPLSVGLATLIAARKALELYATPSADMEFPEKLSLKWPNDVLIERDGVVRKLAGILVESESHTGHLMRLVIGVGLNWRKAPLNTDAALFSPGALFEHGETVPVDEFTPIFVNSLNLRLKELFRPELLLKELRSNFFLAGKRVLRKGLLYDVVGLADDGSLVISDPRSGELKTLYDADWEAIY